jgi:hypothetical protein
MKEAINRIISIGKEHILLTLYSFVFFVLLIGVYSHSEFKYFPLLAIFIGTLFTSYFLLNNYLSSFFTKLSDKVSLNINFFPLLNIIVFFSIIGFIFLHYIYMDGVPLFKALVTLDHLEVSRIRNEVTTNCPKWINYLASFYIKAIIPFYLFYFFHQKKYTLFTILFLVSGFYTLSLLQKSYIVTIILPLFIFFLLSKKWLFSILSTTFIVCSVLFLTRVANPHLNNEASSKVNKQEIIDTSQTVNQHLSSVEQPPKNEHQVVTMAKSLIDRVFIIPGEIVSIWFSYIPEKLPYLNGCGYRFLTPVLNCEHIKYPEVIYDLEFPEYAKLGVKGTLVTSTFMHDYANFGVIGLFISGIILSFVFFLIKMLFTNNFKLLLVFNLTPVLLLSSSALSTLLLSHGWMLSVALFVIYSKQIIKHHTTSE